MLAITTMFGTGDDIACRNVPLKARKLKTSQKNEIVNYLDKLLYTGLRKFKQYPKLQPTQPKREMFEALMPWLEAFLTYLRCCFFPKKEQMWTYTMLIMVLKFPLKYI